MTKAELRTEFNRPLFKQKLREYHGCRCVNCNSDDRVEYHHIVALADGGTNNITNIVPLCWECHQKAHGSKNVRERHRAVHTGRPSKKLNEIERNVQLFIDCRIGAKEFKEEVGLGKATHINDNKAVKEYLHSIGIKPKLNTYNCNIYVVHN